MIQLSAALPRLEWLDLGLPCSETSSTTVSCLLALSVHCKNLRNLRVHSNTANLTDDIRFLSEDPDLGGLQSLPARCPLESLVVGGLSFPNVTPCDITTTAKGFVDIFPSISRFKRLYNWDWDTLGFRVCQIRAMQAGSLIEKEHVSDR